MKPCPLCKEEIQDDAIKCRYCHSMLVAVQGSSQPPDDDRVTYVVDRDLVRFAKFAGAVLGIFLIVGAFFFGFKLDNALEKVRDTQEKLTTAQAELAAAQADLKEAQSTVNALESDVRETLSEARQHLASISRQRQLAVEIVLAMGNRPDLNEEGQARLAQAKADEPNRFRESPLGAKLWKNGSVIRVRFLDGSDIVQNKVKTIAQEWVQDANLTFEFTDEEDAEIRVSFEHPGSWSYQGTDCLGIPKIAPTTNFGWLSEQTDDAEAKAIVLREFGFALGLIDELKNPKAEIPWDKPAVYASLTGPPNYWTKERVDHQLFNKYTPDELPDYRDFDPTSIMVFPIPNDFTVGDFEIERPIELSPSDRLLIARLYPKDDGKN